MKNLSHRIICNSPIVREPMPIPAPLPIIIPIGIGAYIIAKVKEDRRKKGGKRR